MKSVLVVGAGFAGAVYARQLAEAGYHVQVIDRRPHIAGNAYDEVLADGTRLHRYGPHLFHTNNRKVVDWLERFGRFVRYEHRVQVALPNGTCVPLPINRITINEVFGKTLRTPEEIGAFLTSLAIPISEPRNAGEYLNSRIGSTLTNLFFRPYTRKMWALDLEDLDASVVKRIPIRTDDEDRYFPDDVYQMLPRHGYTNLFSSIFNHPNVHVALNQPFSKNMLHEYMHCFNSMAIDEYYENIFGPLPYRSIRFHHMSLAGRGVDDNRATTNFSDDGPYTRETDWMKLPYHYSGSGEKRTVTREQPCDYAENNMERYYPVKVSDGRFDRVYQKYKILSSKEKHLTFIGRCGTYQYLDMHQVINQALSGVERWLDGIGPKW